jgi:hypothetical protein
MIPVLSLVVAILAVLFGPLVARANLRQQLARTAQETWLREFREQVALFLAAQDALRQHRRDSTTTEPEKREAQIAEINDRRRPAYHTIRLLLAQQGLLTDDVGAHRHPYFLAVLDRLIQSEDGGVGPLASAAEVVMRAEWLSISTAPTLWNSLRDDLGLGAPWSRLVSWWSGLQKRWTGGP